MYSLNGSVCVCESYTHMWLEASVILWFRSCRCTEALVCLFQREFQISLLWTADQSELISAPTDGGPAAPGHEAATLLPETEVDTHPLCHFLLSVSLVPVFLSPSDSVSLQVEAGTEGGGNH